ncbi:hypothetical protein L596_006133 [Steinernema carpocapsae]|uniref:RNA-directed DNA polymerase n=1 Tax=Steinernema carpocapsae TaxID=34508 RepID=A0A4U8V199_STECR|nr:hypothetical protein L596_006133 [Steinernema carpocapsae]
MQATEASNMEALLALLQQTFGPSAASAAANVDSLAAQLDTFDYDEDAGVTFTAWHDRHRRVFDKDAAALKDPEKVSLLLRKLSSATYHRYAKLLRPRKPEDQTFEETVAELNKVFGERTSLFAKRYRCFQLRRRPGQPMEDFFADVNSCVEDAEVANFTPDQVKCLCAIAGLLQREDESTRRLLLQKMEKEPEAKLVDLLEEYRRWSKLQDDSDLVSKKKDFQCINAVNTPNPRALYPEQPSFWKQKRKKNDVRRSSPHGSCHQPDAAEAPHRHRSYHLHYQPRCMEPDGPTELAPSDRDAVSFGGSQVSLKGFIHATFRQPHEPENNLRFDRVYVTTMPDTFNLIGNKWLKMLGFWDPHAAMIATIKKDSGQEDPTVPSSNWHDLVKKRFPKLLDEGLGEWKRGVADLQLKPNSKAIFRRCRPVPHHVKPQVDAEIQRLQDIGVLAPIKHSSLNDQLVADQHPLPTPAAIFASLSEGRIFTQIDLSDAYLQIPLSEDAMKLAVINTHRGLYAYQRLPFGIKTAPGLFQRIMDETLAGIQGATTYLDDIIIIGRNEADHRKNLYDVLQRLEEAGFRIRLDKTPTRWRKIEAIAKMPEPKDLHQLRSFLGMVTYYQVFVKNLHELRKPLDQLLKKDVDWTWTEKQQEAVTKIKSVLLSDLLLTHYDPQLPIVVAADASPTGIGCVLLHQFPDGSTKAPNRKGSAGPHLRRQEVSPDDLRPPLHLLTDHKPLLAVFGSKKGVPPHRAGRLQRWAILLQAYDFEIQYRNTLEFGQADALSRLIAPQEASKEDVVIATIQDYCVNSIAPQMPINAEDVRRRTDEDPELSKIKKLVQEGRPGCIKNDPSLGCYYGLSQYLSLDKGCLMFGDRVLLPRSLHGLMLHQLHQGHPGMNRMKRLARSLVYWPKMHEDIDNMVRNCEACAKSAKKPAKNQLSSWPKPLKPWSRLHIDYAGPIDQEWFLIAVDAYSKWPEVISTRSTTASSTVRLLKKIFAQHGIPDLIVSDNGTQFTSQEFKTFCELTASSTRRPPRTTRSQMRVTSKLRWEGKRMEAAIEEFLFTYRTTPKTDGRTPSEDLMGRKLRTINDLVKPAAKPSQPLSKDRKMEAAFNRQHGAKKREFQPEEAVLVSLGPDKAAWTEGTVIKRLGSTMYEVSTERRRLRCHANQMLKSFLDSERSNDAEFLMRRFQEDQPTPPRHPEGLQFTPQRHGPSATPVAANAPVRHPRSVMARARPWSPPTLTQMIQQRRRLQF